jgi:acyl carrier protein phosphodiesterase
MNWLAHLFLSESSPEFRLGNLLPDLVGLEHQRIYSGDVRRGIVCHQCIDAFTDSHPVVRRSIERLGAKYRRLGGILIDMFYDHLLAANWRQYSDMSLEEFAREVYQSLEIASPLAPPIIRQDLRRMRDSNLLCSYRELGGIETALSRIGMRFRAPIELGHATEELRCHYAALADDFSRFFPELQRQVASFSKVNTGRRRQDRDRFGRPLSRSV